MRSFLRGFGYAISGFWVAVKEERNLRFHLCAAAYATLLSLFYPFGKTEYAVLTLLVGAVISVELINSAIERAVGPPLPGKPNKRDGQVKDIAAGAVLVLAIAAVACGFFLFWDTEVFCAIYKFFTQNPLLLLPLLASFACSYWFVARFGDNGLSEE